MVGETALDRFFLLLVGIGIVLTKWKKSSILYSYRQVFTTVRSLDYWTGKVQGGNW
jgi:hypothetical protein